MPRTSQAVVAKPPERQNRERHDQHHDHGRDEPVAELDHLMLLEEGQQPPSAERPAVGAAAGRAAAEARVADPDDPADHDQRERGSDGGGEEAAEADQLVRFAARGDAAASRSGYRGAAAGRVIAAHVGLGLAAGGSPGAGAVTVRAGGGLQLSARSRIARRMSCSGSALRTSGTASKLCSGGGESANHSSVAPPHGSWPDPDAVAVAVGGVAELEQDPDREHEAGDRGDEVEAVHAGVAEVLVDVHRLRLEPGEERHQHVDVEAEQDRRQATFPRPSPSVRPVSFGNQ